MWLEEATIPLVVACLVVALGGWRLLWATSPAIAFLYFMLPLPPSLNAILADPLQRLATIGSTGLLQLIGLPVLAEGNVIFVGADRLEVARACNGLSMLLSFVTLITATVLTVARDRPVWERVVLLLSTLPIALVANILRIAATAVLYYAFGPNAPMFWPVRLWFPTVDQLAHDTAGWAMMPMALALIFLEMRLLSWLVVEEEAAAKPMLFFPAAGGGDAAGEEIDRFNQPVFMNILYLPTRARPWAAGSWSCWTCWPRCASAAGLAAGTGAGERGAVAGGGGAAGGGVRGEAVAGVGGEAGRRRAGRRGRAGRVGGPAGIGVAVGDGATWLVCGV